MNFYKLLCVMGCVLISSCAVKTSVKEEYQLNAFSDKKSATHPHAVSLLVTSTEAASAYQTQEMLYVDKPFQLEAFAKNAWKSPPADMLYPLLVESLQKTGYFYAIASTPSAGADFRVDTQILRMQQSFLKKPSVLDFAVKIVLVRVEDNQVIASRIISGEIPCPSDTPYGGVVAANQASYQLTKAASAFVVRHVKAHEKG